MDVFEKEVKENQMLKSLIQFGFFLTIVGYSTTALSIAPPELSNKAFSQQCELFGIRFNVISPNTSQENTVRIVPSGLTINNSALENAIKGQVIGAEAADINADGSPEIYVYVRDNDPRKLMTLVAYSTNHLKSMSLIHLPALSKARLKEYCGGDEMSVVENTFVRRFPICKQGKASQQMRQIQYKLKLGEATWQLKVSKMLQY